VRREQLESRFVALLQRLQPNVGYMRLLREVVLDVCQWLSKWCRVPTGIRARRPRRAALMAERPKTGGGRRRPNVVRELASLMPASWNRFVPWLRAVDELRRAA
jgi:hypothetical protein